jgi:hypothetical protein
LSGMISARRAGASVATVLMLSAATTLLTSPSASADLQVALSNCRSRQPAQNSEVVGSPLDNGPLDGGRFTTWTSQARLLHFDVLRITASGTARIDNWGANKYPIGDPELAPSGWPLQGARKYALLVKINWPPGDHQIETFDSRGARSSWFPVNAPGFFDPNGTIDSGCMAYQGVDDAELAFEINDDNFGDNGGGPVVGIQQYW